MRRIVPLVLLLALGGCGYQTWSNLPFTGGTMPNKPAGDSETMLRVEGHPVPVKPLTPQAGNVWPGPLPPTPTLQDIEKRTNLQPLPEEAVPGSPMARGTAPAAQMPPSIPPLPTQGSSTPPVQVRGSAPPPAVVPPATPPSAAVTPPVQGTTTGQVVHTPRGTGVVSGGGKGYQTMTTPNGGSAVVIPNGNGTSTIIRSDGSIETIPTPKK